MTSPFRKLKPEAEQVLQDHEEKYGAESTDQIRAFLELFFRASPKEQKQVHKDIQARIRSGK